MSNVNIINNENQNKDTKEFTVNYIFNNDSFEFNEIIKNSFKNFIKGQITK